MIREARTVSFRACNRSGGIGDIAPVHAETEFRSYHRGDGACPVHQTAGCVETYISTSRLAELTLTRLVGSWLRWRRETKRRWPR